MTAEEIEESALRQLSICTVSWKGVKLDGQELECNPDNAYMLYSRLPWLKEQVDEFVGDRANFLKA